MAPRPRNAGDLLGLRRQGAVWLGLVAAGLAAAPSAHAAALTLRPAAAPPGAQVSVAGAGFRPGGVVALRLAGRTLGRPHADRAGRFHVAFVQPSGPAGTRRMLSAIGWPTGRGRAVTTAAGPGLSPSARVRGYLDTLAGPPAAPAPVEVALSGGARLRFASAAEPGQALAVTGEGLPAGALAAVGLHAARRSGSAAAAGAPAALAAVRARTGRSGRMRVRLALPHTALAGSAPTVELRAGATRMRAALNVMPRGTRVPPLGPSARPAPLMLAAGDVACRPAAPEVADACHQDATGLMVAGSHPEVVAALGDVQYERGASDEFSAYDASWGFALPRTRPAVGNHEYKTPGAAPYYRYFGAFAGQPGQGYYSYEVGSWHVVVLNSNCAIVGCAAGSLQERWLRADLAARPAACTVAYAHHPRFSSGTWRASNESLTALFAALYDHRVDLFLAGHDHIYERMAPLGPAGTVERDRGVRPFVVGTGGRGFSSYRARAPGRESTQAFAFGVLLLSLKPRAYSWLFAAERPQAFRDGGFDDCR